MLTNPKPGHRVAIEHTNCSMTEGDSDSLYIFFCIDAFEMQRWMPWVFSPFVSVIQRHIGLPE